MIKSENAPTLCPRCVHFTKNWDVGCKIGNWGIESDAARDIQRWLTKQSDESSWTYLGACPGFVYNGSDAHLMDVGDRSALRKLLKLETAR